MSNANHILPKILAGRSFAPSDVLSLIDAMPYFAKYLRKFLTSNPGNWLDVGQNMGDFLQEFAATQCVLNARFVAQMSKDEWKPELQHQGFTHFFFHPVTFASEAGDILVRFNETLKPLEKKPWAFRYVHVIGFGFGETPQPNSEHGILFAFSTNDAIIRAKLLI